MKPQVLVLRAPGTNCDEETAWAFELAGASATAVHIHQLLADPRLLRRFQILCFPGGFSFGDDVSAGQILASRLRTGMIGELHQFRDDGKLILGICNGFQVLVKTGLLGNEDAGGFTASLTWNTNGRYTAKWVSLSTAGGSSEPDGPADRSQQGPCVFLRGIRELYLPMAHGEGRFVVRDQAELIRLENAGQLALRYVEGVTGGNPNGSTADVAGMCDPTGRVFGLMPHPERNVHLTHHPRWTRLDRNRMPDGLRIFQNAVAWFAA